MSASTLYRFRIDLTDIDRGVYEKLDFRVALHPSESLSYLLTRVFAYCLNFQDGLEFSQQGLGDPEGPTLLIKDANGIKLWIEIGNPSAKKLHKAAKGASGGVKVYTYKNPKFLLQEISAKEIHRAEKIEIYSLASDFLDLLAEKLPRDVRWSVLHHDGLITVSWGEESEQTEILFCKI